MAMSKCNIGGHDFFYERVPIVLGEGENKREDKRGVAIFKIADEDEGHVELYWCVIPTSRDKWDEGCESPSDGHVMCMCRNEMDAKMVASSVNISRDIVSTQGTIGEILRKKFAKLEDKYDTDAMSKEIDRLAKEGKSSEEVLEYMMSRREEFLRKKDIKEGGEW